MNCLPVATHHIANMRYHLRIAQHHYYYGMVYSEMVAAKHDPREEKNELSLFNVICDA